MGNLGSRLDLLQLLVVREVRVRYARTLLGVAWAVVHPLTMLGVFTLLNFKRMVPESSDYGAVPYPVFAFVGLVFWNHFAQSLVTGTASLPAARDMLHKSRFPAQLIPLSRMCAWMLDLGIGCALIVILMLLFDRSFHTTALLVPVVFLLQAAFTAGVVLFLSALNLFFRDVQYVLQVFVLLLMFASNVIFPLEGIHPAAADVLSMNPIVSYLDAYRHLLLVGSWPQWADFAPGVYGAGISLLVGGLYFRRVSPRFAEEV